MVVVIGVMAAVATLAIGGNHQRSFQQEVSRLQQQLNLAQDHVLFEQQIWGVEFGDQGYRFLQLDGQRQRWNEITEKPFAAQIFEQPIELKLEIAGSILTQLQSTFDEEAKTISTAPLPTAEQQDKNQHPQLVFLPSGENSAFELLLRLKQVPETQHLLASDGFSTVAHRINHHDL